MLAPQPRQRRSALDLRAGVAAALQLRGQVSYLVSSGLTSAFLIGMAVFCFFEGIPNLSAGDRPVVGILALWEFAVGLNAFTIHLVAWSLVADGRYRAYRDVRPPELRRRVQALGPLLFLPLAPIVLAYVQAHRQLSAPTR